MPTPNASRRTRFQLTVSSPGEPEEAPVVAPTRVPYVPWLVAALAWSAGVAVLGLATVTVLLVVGWLTALRTSVAAVVQTAGQVWLSVHQVAAEVHPLSWHLAPLTLTLTLAAACAVVGHHAAGQVQQDADAPASARWGSFAGVVVVCSLAYAATCGVIASLIATTHQAVDVLLPALAIAAVGSGYGALRGLDLHPLAGLPAWGRRLPGAAAVGVGVISLAAVLALSVGLVAHHDRVGAAVDALAPDAVGVGLLVLLHLCFGPNLVAWVGSWVLGAGTSFGPGTLVAPGVTQVGALPAVPVFGAIPVVPSVWSWGWLATGLVAGAAAGWWVVRRVTPAADDAAASDNNDEAATPASPHTVWQAALGGLAAALAWLAFSWVARGDLGTERLVGMGPVFPDLLWWASAPLVVAAATAGLVAFLRARPRPTASSDAEPDAELVAVGGGDRG